MRSIIVLSSYENNIPIALTCFLLKSFMKAAIKEAGLFQTMKEFENKHKENYQLQFLLLYMDMDSVLPIKELGHVLVFHQRFDAGYHNDGPN